MGVVSWGTVGVVSGGPVGMVSGGTMGVVSLGPVGVTDSVRAWMLYLQSLWKSLTTLRQHRFWK